MSGVEDLKVLTGETVSGENHNLSENKSDILNEEEQIENDKVSDGTLDDPDIRDCKPTNEIINLETAVVKSRMQNSIDKCDWTLVEKEDIPKDFDEGFSRSVTQEETDSESIETISDDELVVKSFTNSLQHKQDVYNSLSSQTSTISDGIPIKNSLDGGVDEQYLWNRDGEQELQESEASVSDMLDEIPAEKEEDRDRAEEREKVENVEEIRIENNDQDENVEDNVAQQEEEEKVEVEDDDSENEDGEENDEYDDRHNADDEDNDLEPVEELERGEPGIDEDDDGFRGNFLVRLLGDLYPSQELDPGFSRIRRGEVYKHNKNFQLNSLLTAVLVLMAAMVIGLGIGHFLGMSEKLEVVEMYDQIQEEKLCHLQDELVTCISGVEGQGGDDQDLDDRVIRALWEENQELRDQVHHLKSNIGDKREEAMTAILRDRINNLLTANGDLEREVVRLRYAEAARGAAESIESREQLRKTRDALNNIVDENDQLKIQVGKYRYGAAPNSAAPSTRGPNSAAPITDESTVIHNAETGKAIDDSDDADDADVADVDIEVDSPEIDENHEMSRSSKLQKEDLSESWPMRRQHDIKREEERRQIDKDGDDENDNDYNNNDDDGDSKTGQITDEYDHTDEGYVSDEEENFLNKEESWEKMSTNQNKPNDDRKIIDDDEDDEHEHPVLKEISRKIAKKLSKFGSKLFDAAGEINWEDTKHFFSGLQEDIGVKLSSLGGLNLRDLNIFQEKFAEIRTFIEKGELEGHVESTKTAARKLLKSLMHSVKDLQEAAKDAAEKSSWKNQLNEEVSKIKIKMERSWTDIKNTWSNIINQKMDKDQQTDSPNFRHKRSQDEKRTKKIKEKEEKNIRRQEEKNIRRQEEKNIRRQEEKKNRNKFAEERGESENMKMDETKGQEHKKDSIEKENKRSRKEYKRERGNKKMKNKEDEEDEEEIEDWTSRRGMGRSLKRNQESKGDWVFERARQRKNVRVEEEKEDWYEARKRRRSRGEECEDDCDNERGECEGEKCNKKMKNEKILSGKPGKEKQRKNYKIDD